MNQDGSSRKSKRVKNSNFIPPGSVASLLSQRVLNHKHKQNSKYIPEPHVNKSNEKDYKHKQNSNYILGRMRSGTSAASPSTQKRKRGGTQMQSVHGRSERKLIVLNELHQPIGPTEAIVKELGSFLGTLARNGTFCPLNVFKWKKLKTHDDMWNYTMEKYDIPKVAKEWALRTIQLAWRKYKNGLKKKHYYRYANDEIRMAKRPKEVSESQFKALLEYWNSDAAQVSKMKKGKETMNTLILLEKIFYEACTCSNNLFAIEHVETYPKS
ncbi:uncharacterized protein LOC132053932 [Lycium ferocissimum]|uniref:uncharacterized protein LOC132053932 n=1 Tax=Lycium ferocissimum TaxID=112874 RepID=UPI002814B97D|nr:uncharacterized protein LOC132053932 [Lycium ferocissimum]